MISVDAILIFASALSALALGFPASQDPAKADKITKIQRDLDETTEVLVSLLHFL